MSHTDVTRVCVDCRANKVMAEFVVTCPSRKTPTTTRRVCKQCRNVRGRGTRKVWKKNNKDKIAGYHRTEKYGPGTLFLVERMLGRQSGNCAICSTHIDHMKGGRSGYRIDHDHEYGLIRGILCNGCNSGLGFFKDSSELMLKAAEYLKKFGG